MIKKEKSLTIVLFGRNDNYNGNYKYRLINCLKFLEQAIINNNLKNRVIINFIDWNSDKPFLQEEIFPKSLKKNIRLFTLSPEFLKKNNHTEKFNIQMCCNIGARRSNEDYVLYTNTDILITEVFLKNLFIFLNNNKNDKCLFTIPRKFLPPYVTESELTFEDLKKYIFFSSRFFKEGGKITGVCSGPGGFLASKKTWADLQGFKEKGMRGHGWNDVEIGIHAIKNCNLLDLDFYGLYLFDMQQSISLKKSINTNQYILREGNNNNWGMGKNFLKYKLPTKSLNYSNFVKKHINPTLSKLTFINLIIAMIKSRVLDYHFVSKLYYIMNNRRERVKNIIIKTNNFENLSFLYFLLNGSFISYFFEEKKKNNFGKEYLRFHYKFLNNKNFNFFKPYINTTFKKLTYKKLLLFKSSIPNIFINTGNYKVLRKNNYFYNNQKYNSKLTNFLIFILCLLNHINYLSLRIFYNLKDLIKKILK